jgi:hypothetical protein
MYLSTVIKFQNGFKIPWMNYLHCQKVERRNFHCEEWFFISKTIASQAGGRENLKIESLPRQTSGVGN